MSNCLPGLVLAACVAAAGPNALAQAGRGAAFPRPLASVDPVDAKLAKDGAQAALGLWSRVVRFVTKPFQTRIADLQDCFRASIGFGYGLSAEVRVGMFTNPALGTTSKTRRIGWESREFCGIWTSTEKPFPLPFMINRSEIPPPDRLVLPVVSYLRRDRRVKQITAHTKTFPTHKFTGYWHPFHRRTKAESGNAVHRALDFEAGATTAIVSARAAINPLEVLDFVLGFFWIDIGRDDED